LNGVERVATIVQAMKEFSHPDSGETELIDLNKALKSTLTVARNEIKYVADVEQDFDPELPLVQCRPGDINQVLLNLLVNAAHAIKDALGGNDEKRGVITVTTRAEGDKVLISVADTGTGIPESVRGRVFDPFFTTKTVGKGTGQGLAIARSVVVDKHGGTLTFETEVGEGTTFFVRLPISKHEAVEVS
jgi:signal transduction histidine kinase